VNKDQEILNLISDLRTDNEEAEALKERISKLKSDLEIAEDDLVALKDSIQSNRERLDDLIDEATGSEEEDMGFRPF
jgi:chromosome segregation ATPase